MRRRLASFSPGGGAGAWRFAASVGDRIVAAASAAALRDRVARLHGAVGLTRAGLAAAGAAVAVWVAAAIVAGRTMYMFAYGMVVVIAIAFAAAPRRLRIGAERVGLYPRAMEGDRFEVRLALTPEKRATTVVVEEQIPSRLGGPVRFPVARLVPGQVAEHRYRLRVERRGVYSIGPLEAISSDPLGLATRRTRLAGVVELLVYPQVEQLSDRPLTRQFEEPPFRPPVSRPWPSGLEFFGLREYSPGDDLRRIVWRASGKTGRIMVREAEQGIVDKVLVLLDTDRGVHSRDMDGVSDSFEAAVRCAASVGVHHLRQGFEVQVDTNGGVLTRPLRGAAARTALLDACARVEMARHPLLAALTRLGSAPPRDKHFVLVTPKLGEHEAARLRMLVDAGVSVLVVALLWDESAAGLPALATGLGCQVVGLRPGQDLASAFNAGIGAGMRG